ncbi:921_t:CDS:1 [Scutellospora calospora]|uniref:921_t:CDS:1 n=1 Tax=Scutellospora calospora TaxID=85575 RepID=A0ACA9LCY8_9GLOM|nr:921_t:CDS:1 [Scutellospora calospora]
MESTDRSKKNQNDEKSTNENVRTKNSQSCDYCRHKRVKCNYKSGVQCSECIKYNEVCTSKPPKKRGPKAKNETDSSTQSNANRDLRSSILQFKNGNKQPLFDLIEEALTNEHCVDNERILSNLIINENLSGNPLNNAETLPRRNSSVNNEQRLSVVTRPSRTTRQPSPTRENRQMRQDNRIRGYSAGVHSSASHSNPSSPSSPIYVSMQSEGEPNLQYSEITQHNASDLSSSLNTDTPEFDQANYITYQPLNYSTSSQLLPFIDAPIISENVSPDVNFPSGNVSPDVNFSFIGSGNVSPVVYFPLTGSGNLSPVVNIPLIVTGNVSLSQIIGIGNVSPHISSTIVSQVPPMSPLDLGDTLLNSTTNLQATPPLELINTLPIHPSMVFENMSLGEIDQSVLFNSNAYQMPNSEVDQSFLANSNEKSQYLTIPMQNKYSTFMR